MNTIAFGRFVLDPKRRVLLVSGDPVKLQSRPFDILEYLAANRERVVSRDEIVDHVWRGQIIAENNLGVQVSMLRRALADHTSDDLIITVPGRGYRFVADVTEPTPISPASVPEAPNSASGGVVSPAPEHTARAPSLKVLRESRRAAVAMFAILGMTYVGTIAWKRLTAPPPPPRLSIAVLPFRNLSDNRDDDYLADAISDDLTTDLAHIPGSLVIARETADTFKGRAVPADQIGRTLNVRYLLEGSLYPEGTVIQVNAQLIETVGGTHIWSERSPIPHHQISVAIDSLVRNIASALNVQLEAIEAARSLRDHRDNPDALDLFLRARALYHNHTDFESITKAQRMLDQALELSPDYVDALVTDAELLITKANGYDDPNEIADIGQARSLIRRAAQVAPTNATFLVAKAHLDRVDGDLAAARGSYEAALATDPNITRAHVGLAVCDWEIGHYQDALAHLSEAARQDPLGPAATWRLGMSGRISFMLGKYEDAASLLERALSDTIPGKGEDDLGNVEWDRLFLIAARDAAGEKVLARQAYQDYAKRWHNRTVWNMLAYLTAAQSQTPGYSRLRDALIDSGMPPLADSNRDDKVTPLATTQQGSDFEPTPTAIPNGKVVDALEVRALMAASPAPVIVDVGRGVAVISGALWEPAPTLRRSVPVQQVIDRASRDPTFRERPVIVLGTGTFGRDGYNAALNLIAAGLSNVFWFRGGEEAWAAAALPSQDRRIP